MEYIGQVLAYTLVLVLILAAAWLAIAAVDTLAWSLSGEMGSLVAGGLSSRSQRRRRTNELQAVIGHIALITRLNMPLPTALRAAARGESGRVRQTLNHLAQLVSAGWPLSEAVHAAFRRCPSQVVAILGRGELWGQLPRAVANVEWMLTATALRNRDRGTYVTYAGAYAGLMLLFCGLLLSWVMLMIMPRFWDIFNDFGAPLPPVTLVLINFCRGVTAYSGAVPIILLLCLVLTAVVVAWQSRTGAAGVLARVIAALRGAMPITRSIDYGLGMATAIRSMALGIRSGAPVDRAAVLTSVVGATNHLRVRLAEFVQEVQAGVVPHAAAQSAGLGDVFVHALRMVERGEDAERTLAHAADYYEAIAYRWWHAVSAVIGPLVTLVIAGCVCFIALALFVPMVSLINSVSDTIP